MRVPAVGRQKKQTKQSKLARSLHTNQPRKEQLGWSSMGKKRKQDQRRDEPSSSDAKRHRSRHCQNGDSSDDGMPDAFRDAVIELKDFIQVKVSTEEKFRRKIEKLKQKRKKDKKKQKEFRKYIKILTEDVRSLKESHEELKSKFQETQKEGCAEVNQYDASPSQRSQLSQSIRFWLAIETEVSKTVYKKERVLTVDGGDRIKVVMYDGINQIKSGHPLASVKVHLVVIEGWFNECKPWTKEEFEKSIVQPRKGITSVVKNGTFNLVNGSCSHEGAIIMDNSQQREVKLGVMIAVHNEERVLEGVSNPFKVQEGRTKNSGSKKKVQKPPSLVPTGNMVQQTGIHKTQHGQGLVSQGEQHSLPPPDIQGLQQKEDRGGHKQFPTDDTVDDNGLKSYPPVTMQLTVAPVPGNGHGNGEKSSQQIPMQFSGQSTSAHSMQHGQDHSLPPRNIQRPLQAADRGGHKQFPTDDTVEDNRLRSYPPVTMQLTGAPVQGNGHALFGNGEKSSQQIPMQFSGQSTSAHSMQHGQDHSLSPCNIRRPLQAADRGGHKQFPTDDTVEDNRLRSYPPVTMQLTVAPVQGNGHALFGNGEKSSQQIPMQFSGQSTSAHSMQHGQDHSLPPRNIQRPLHAADQFELDCGQDWDAYFRDASPELESTFSAYTSNGLQTGQWTSIPGGEISVEDAHHLNAQKQIQETSGSLTCGQVLLLWDKPDVELKQRFDFLNQIMPPFSTHRESFPSTSLIYKAHKLLASATRTPPHRRGILIRPIEPYNSDDEPTVKKQRHAKYQLRFVNRVCNDYYTREHIKSDNGNFLKVALYDENNLVVTSGPLSSASVEVVLLHGDFNAEGEDNWTSEEFSTFLVCPQSVKEPPGVGGDRVLVLIDGEADLSNINFQNSSFHARTGKFKMGVELRNVREERVQEGITSSFLVRVRQGEGGLSKNRNVGCGGYSEVYKENKNTMENKSQDRSAMTVKDFSYKQLIEITNNFSKDHIVGRGTYGVVYKGVLKTGIPIAVKKLYQNIGHDNEKQFKNDFTRLMEIKHKNIVRFLCYINDVGKERALCFEYLARGNLHKHISDAFSGCDWSTRYGIIKGICEGLNYLHSNQIYHLDLKPSNILLDDHMVPKIADFGLSRVFIDSTHSTREIVVTRPGYMPPEYVTEQIISNRCDVFSLGVIIIEIMTGSMGYCKTAEQSQQEFILNVHENWRKRLQRTMLPRASEQVQQVQRCIKLALKCAEANWMKRPTLTEIVDELNKIDAANSSSGSSYISTLEKQDELCGQQYSKMETKGVSDSEEELSEEELMSKEELYLKPDHEVMKLVKEENLYLRRNKVTRRKIQLFRP